MQFHLNGFRPGDPDWKEEHANRTADLTDGIDVLIVGCGPAGLTLAAQLSQFPEINTRIIEAADGPLQRGHADGISVRTMEMFEAFGFAERVKREAYWVNETTFWKPDPDDPARIQRSGRIRDVEEGLSHMPHVILNQARVHDMYLDVMAKSARRLTPDYGCRLTGVTVDEGNDFPVSAHVTRSAPDGTSHDLTLRARYLVGCDGARSVVRGAIGREMSGDFANKAWGVMDVLAVTDFPDIRCKSLIRSHEHGNIVLIPREGGYLARFYIELDALSPEERVRNKNIRADDLIAAANRILAPYTLDVRQVAWWSVYEIGQRLTDRFDDGDDDRAPHVFIAGDACHTHSPKAGQGMNVSMGDAFNLGWKLAAVLRAQSSPSLLRSYSMERHGVADDLIAFDKEWTQVLAKGDEGGTGTEFQSYFIKHGRYTAGTAVRYGPSLLTGDAQHQALASGFQIGTRLHSAPVIRLADALPMQLSQTIAADGRWRLFAFADDTNKHLGALCDFLMDDPGSPLRRHTPSGQDADAILDFRAIYQDWPRDASPMSQHAMLLPRKGSLGLVDYEKAFFADQMPDRDIFTLRGINRQSGALMILRPDQYVADLMGLTDFPRLQAFFERVLTKV